MYLSPSVALQQAHRTVGPITQRRRREPRLRAATEKEQKRGAHNKLCVTPVIGKPQYLY